MPSGRCAAERVTGSGASGRGWRRALRARLGRGAHLGRHLGSGSPVTLTAAAGLIVVCGTAVVDAATSASSRPTATFAFQREVGSGSQLFVSDLSGTRQHQLTFGPGSAETPRWAPSGERILYLLRPPHDAHLPDLMVMSARGRHKQKLLAGGTTHFISDMAWSPSGRRIVLVRTLRDGFSDLFLFTLADRTLVRMHVNSEPSRDPATVDWAPDGRIYFSAVDYTHDGDVFEDHDLFVVGPDGTGLTELTDTPMRDELHPRVSPDGRRLLYADRSYACSSVRIANVDASRSARLPTGCLAFQGSWAAGGERVLLQELDPQGNFVLHSASADGTHRRFVTDGQNADWRPEAR